LMGIGAVGLVVVFSMKPPPPPHDTHDTRFELRR
jgi:hypothetical protein